MSAAIGLEPVTIFVAHPPSKDHELRNRVLSNFSFVGFPD